MGRGFKNWIFAPNLFIYLFFILGPTAPPLVGNVVGPKIKTIFRFPVVETFLTSGLTIRGPWKVQ